MTYFALIPAAGGGSRMGGACPKQYLPLAGRPMIYHALATLAAVPSIERIVVVLSPNDSWWRGYDWGDLQTRLTIAHCGGVTRAESVANGLRVMRNFVRTDDWVLVHDAARPCLQREHVEKLISEVGNDPVGGLLAIPLTDTLKRALAPTSDGVRVAATIPREGLWQAQTPQMFRYGMLLDALEAAPGVTDEASAIEALGFQPLLVTADATNFKVTYPLDLRLAEWILACRRQ